MKMNNLALPHQQEAKEKLIKLKVGALFMEQGTGKTYVALDLALHRYVTNKIDHIIWLCPCSAKMNIAREIIKQCPKELASIVTICGIETLSSSIRANTYLLNLTSTMRCFIIIDESLLVKNPYAYRTKNITNLAAKCAYRLILNGTPFSKNEADLYAQFYLLDWRILGYRSYWSFAANHLEFDEYNRLRRTLNTDYLAEKIAPYLFQIRKKDCLTLPDKHYHSRHFSMTDKQSIEYDRCAEILLGEMNEWRPETIYRLFSGLQAVISGKRLVFSENLHHFETEEMFKSPYDNPRIKRLLEILPDEKAIIFCRYESEISMLCDILPGAVRFDGKIPLSHRDKQLLKFSNEGKYLIANKNCAGYSLNLQFCHNIINLSNDWDLGTRLQSEDRVHRLGQEEQVNITDICAFNTIDEQIISCLLKKENLLDSIKKEIDKKTDVRDILKDMIYGNKKVSENMLKNELEV